MKTKICGYCKKEFECGAEDIGRCFCKDFKLTSAQADELAKTFCDCICKSCLLKLSIENA